MNEQLSPRQGISSEEVSYIFFAEVSKELGLSLKVTSAVIGKIFTCIRKSLAPEEVSFWVTNLPDLLQLHFTRQWRYTEGRVDLSHLDILVESVYHSDRRSEHRVFASEIEALNAIIVVLSKLDRLINILNYPGFKFSFTQEVRQALLEPAA